MLRKLLKYDLAKIYKPLLIFYSLAIFFAVIARIVLSIEDGPVIWFIIGQIAVGAMWAMTVSAVINSVIRPCVKFRLSFYGDESYLAHTLPVKTSVLYFEKFLTGAITLFCSLILMIVALYITYFPLNEVSGLLDLLNQTLGAEKGAVALFLFGIFYIEILAVFSVGMAGIVFGRKMKSNKNLWGVIFGFLLWLLIQLIIVGAVAGLGLFDSDVLKLFSGNNNAIPSNVIKEAAICALICYALCTAGLQLLAGRSVCNKFDVD